jgi:hypothetical protein
MRYVALILKLQLRRLCVADVHANRKDVPSIHGLLDCKYIISLRAEQTDQPLTTCAAVLGFG